jgi:hypothetical protein
MLAIHMQAEPPMYGSTRLPPRTVNHSRRSSSGGGGGGSGGINGSGSHVAAGPAAPERVSARASASKGAENNGAAIEGAIESIVAREFATDREREVASAFASLGLDESLSTCPKGGGRSVHFEPVAVFLNSAAIGDLGEVVAMLKVGVDINSKSPTGLSALCQASEPEPRPSSHAREMNWLRARGSNPCHVRQPRPTILLRDAWLGRFFFLPLVDVWLVHFSFRAAWVGHSLPSDACRNPANFARHHNACPPSSARIYKQAG